MNLQKLSLAERIQRYQNGKVTYPEYIPSVIRRLGQTPVMEYLTGIDPKQQRRFAELADVRCADTTYQWAALRITRRNPSAAAEAMRILAEPMIRYAAMSDPNGLPPQKYPPARLPMPGERRTLAQRLQHAARSVGEAPFFHIYCLYTDTYFYSLDTMFGGESYTDMLEILLGPDIYRYEEIPTLPRFVYNSRELSQEDQTQLLYQALIRPFAEFQKEQERMEIECLSLPF